MILVTLVGNKSYNMNIVWCSGGCETVTAETIKPAGKFSLRSQNKEATVLFSHRLLHSQTWF